MAEELELTEEEQKQLEEIQKADTEELKPENVVEPEPEVTPEPKVEPEPEVEPEPKTKEKEKQVPLAALHEARAEIKALRDKVTQTEQSVAYIDQLKQEILAIKQKQAPPEKVVSYDEDPFGYTQTKLKEYDEKFSALEQWGNQAKQQEETSKLYKQVSATVVNDEEIFAKDHPDYYEAVSFVRDKRRKELEMLGINDPAIFNNDWVTNAYQLAIISLKNQKSPAQCTYEIAKSYGYQPKQEKSNLLETVNKGQKVASRSISQGGVPEVEPSLEALLNAEGEEFDKLWKKTFSKFIR